MIPKESPGRWYGPGRPLKLLTSLSWKERRDAAWARNQEASIACGPKSATVEKGELPVG